MRIAFITSLIASFALAAFVNAAAAQKASDIAPTGKLRIATVGNNPVLVRKTADGSTTGIAADLGKYIGDKLGVGIQFIDAQDPAEFTKALAGDGFDIAIGPRDSETGAGVPVSKPFMNVENLYIVRPGSTVAAVADVDKPGIRIAVAKDGAPDKYISPRIKAAELVRIPGDAPSAVEALKSGKGDVYVSNAVNVYTVLDALPGAKVLSEPLTVVPMAVAVPKARASQIERVSAMVEEAKRAGLPAKAISRDKLRGVRPVD